MAKTSNYLFKLDLIILSLLKERDMYGYEITKLISKKSNGLIVAKQGTMYPIIHKLLEKEYISSKPILVNNKARVYYHLEDSGKEYLESIKDDYLKLVETINLIVFEEE